MKSLAVITPKEIGLEFTVKTFFPSLDMDYLHYLIHYVLSKLSMRIEAQKNDSNKGLLNNEVYVPIYSKKLIVSSKKHSKHIRFLGETWIGKLNIFYRRNYGVGNSFSYKLSPHYDKNPLIIKEIKSGVLSSNIKKSMSNLNPVLFSTSGKYKFLGKFFNSKLLKIDLAEATKLSQIRYCIHNDYNKHLKEMSSVVELNNGIYRTYYNKETDGRIHSNITRLNKIFRQYVTYNNKNLVEVDLSNSIIYFLALILTNRINLCDSNLSFSSLLYMFNITTKSVDNTEKELIFELATKGNFYDFFINEFEKVYEIKMFEKLYLKENEGAYNGTYKQKRKVVKGQILKSLFANVNQFKTEQTIISNKFPTLIRALNIFKKEHGYKKLSHLLMQIEAHIILNEVARGFNKVYYRKAPLYTLHDCLITTCDYEKELLVTMKKEFVKLFGVAPKLESKLW